MFPPGHPDVYNASVRDLMATSQLVVWFDQLNDGGVMATSQSHEQCLTV